MVNASTQVIIGQQVTKQWGVTSVTPKQTKISFGYTSYGQTVGFVHGYVQVDGTLKYSDGTAATDAVAKLNIRVNSPTGPAYSAPITVRSDGTFSIRIPVDGVVNTIGSSLPQTWYYEVVVSSSAAGPKTFTSSTTTRIQPKPTQVTIRTDKTTYNYNENISTFVKFTTTGGEVNWYVPVFARIKRPDGSIVDLGGGKHISTTLSDTETQLPTIPVNTTIFPTAGTYIIEVADNPSYAAAAVTPMQVGIQDLMSMSIELLMLVMIMIPIMNLITKMMQRTKSPSASYIS